jgi:predicted GNAT superfamily acetyltransferase
MKRMDEASVLALNAAHERETSPLDLDALRRLVGQAFHVGLREGGRGGFLIALTEEAAYDNDNFAWFKARYPRFVYVDRVIVAPASRGGGLARGLYEDLFGVAAASGRDVIACEINLEPPNPASDGFHRALGFSEAGRVCLPSGKLLRMLVRTLSTTSP